MKYLLTTLLLTSVIFCKAQIVNIPDTNFRNKLISIGVDANGDRLIQQSEAEAAINLEIGWSNISDFTGIQYFINLKRLNIGGNPAQQILLQNFNQLKTILAGTVLQVKSLKIYNCPKLDSLFLRGTYQIDTLVLNNCDSLNTIIMEMTKVGYYNINGLKKMQQFRIDGEIKRLEISNSPSLHSIIHPQTGDIGIADYFSVNGCRNLNTLDLWKTTFTNQLDLSNCPNLKHLRLAIRKTSFINIKNGAYMQDCIIGSQDSTMPILNICADEFEIPTATNFGSAWLYVYTDALASYPMYYHNSSANYNLYSCYTPTTSAIANTIKGKIRFNLNSNGCDSIDNLMQNVRVHIIDTLGNNFLSLASNNGNYTYNCYKGTFTLTPQFSNPYFTVSPSTATVTFDTANSLTAVRDFCITPNGVHNDVQVTVSPSWPPARPGFNAAYILTYKNKGTTTLSGTINVNFDNNKVNFVSASETVASQSTNQISWNYNNLQPFESKTITITFNLLPPPINNIGDSLSYMVSITPTTNDETEADNSFVLTQPIQGSYDPNEKVCSEGDKIAINKIGDYLHYQIHFQNEGTDTAFNIAVVDNLSNKYDVNSFEFIGSSHPCNVKRSNNKLEFFFENIHLPYKTINEPASHGYVSFKIKPKASIVMGDSLNNEASIYFDYNLPIVTNKTKTVVSSATTLGIKMQYFSISSNINANTLNWKAPCTASSAIFAIERSTDGINFTSLHSIVANSKRCQLPFNYVDNVPLQGKNYYRIKITSADNKIFYSKILSANNDKQAIEVTAVVNNNIYLSSNKQQAIQLKVVAVDGRVLYASNNPINKGNNVLPINLSSIPKGVYTLLIYNSTGEIVTKKFVK